MLLNYISLCFLEQIILVKFLCISPDFLLCELKRNLLYALFFNSLWQNYSLLSDHFASAWIPTIIYFYKIVEFAASLSLPSDCNLLEDRGHVLLFSVCPQHLAQHVLHFSVPCWMWWNLTDKLSQHCLHRLANWSTCFAQHSRFRSRLIPCSRRQFSLLNLPNGFYPFGFRFFLSVQSHKFQWPSYKSNSLHYSVSYAHSIFQN